jgi:hypothetical protein
MAGSLLVVGAGLVSLIVIVVAGRREGAPRDRIFFWASFPALTILAGVGRAPFPHARVVTCVGALVLGVLMTVRLFRERAKRARRA